MAYCAALKWSLKLGQVLSSSGLSCHFRMSLEKMVDRVIMMMPMLMSCVVVSAACTASAMLAYLLMSVNIFTMGRAWSYVVASTFALAAARVWGVISPYVSNKVWMMTGIVPSRRPVSSSIRLARQS
jgi:hypothetical protein